jgi:hypothetical protein
VNINSKNRTSARLKLVPSITARGYHYALCGNLSLLEKKTKTIFLYCQSYNKTFIDLSAIGYDDILTKMITVLTLAG